MGYSLDELLDATGINELDGSQLRKTAASSEQCDFSKLAERCREAADATPSEVEQSDHRELVEKTAAIAVIEKTLSEIGSIVGAPLQKTAAARKTGFGRAAFIKSALEAGHDPENIAKFLEKKKKDEEEEEEEKASKKKTSSSIVS